MSTYARSAALAHEWTVLPQADTSVLTQHFTILVEDQRVPGILWTPTQAVPVGTQPLVLIGHGGSGAKLDNAVLALALPLVQRHGMAVAAIDGPVHGERRADDGGDRIRVRDEFRQLWRETVDGRIASMVADWSAAIDAILIAREEIAPDRIGYCGISMGTMYGLPLAAHDHRISAAVFGLCGVNFTHGDRLATNASLVTCPVLYFQQWDDEIFDRSGVLTLFDALGTRDKRLLVNLGGHANLSGEQMEYAERFLVAQLTRGDVRSERSTP